ncbi:hypothetical protein M1523_02160 [Patescibacteria group bacterium]|nr:hypothetical protein [Patescibacteria group bacterium]MCL5091471.1 hypothetical protein [Patescibacteria group bacterium]
MKRGFIVGAVLVIGLSLYQLLLSDRPVTNLSQYLGTASVFKINTGRDFVKGVPVKGSFTAKENNLGMVKIRFDGQRINDDRLTFRIKEKGSHHWYYEQTYYTVQFIKLPLFPFGFPIIPDSQGKTYTIELSVSKGQLNGVSLDPSYPGVVLGYAFPKSQLIHHPQLLLSFLTNKAVFSLNQGAATALFITDVLYFLLYVLYLVVGNRALYRHVNIIAILLLSFFDIFANHSLTLVTGLIWFVLLVFYSSLIDDYAQALVRIIPLYVIPYAYGMLTHAYFVSYKSGLWMTIFFTAAIVDYWRIRLSRRTK